MIGTLMNKVNTRLAQCYNPINVRIVKSAVLNFAPWLELHHVVFLTPNTQSKGVFAIDFTPINQEDIKTVMKLIKGQNVPAEIRVKYIQGSSIKDKEELELMHKTIERIYRRWNTRMNFYTHNCIHFSHFVRNMLKEDDVCPV